MTPPQTNLEVKGNLLDHPLAELLAEIFQSDLSGALRASHAEHKTIIYFESGRVIYAASNARQHRLFHHLLRDGEISAPQLAAIPNFANDVELQTALLKRGTFKEIKIKELLARQVTEILAEAFAWHDGSWTFSPLVRLKEGIRVPVQLADPLFEYGRKLPVEKQVRRFKSLHERFERRAELPLHVNLEPHEAFVFSRFDPGSHSIEEIKNLSGLSEAQTLRALYVLWLGGFLARERWNSAFSRDALKAMSSARLELKKSASAPKAASGRRPYEKPEEKAKAPQVTLEDYLKRVEEAESYYHILGIANTAETSVIKNAYLQLAKHFHPDLFYRRVEDALHRRIQSAFTGLAQAYETLRNPESREVYDYKLQREIASASKRAKTGSGAKSPTEMIADQAAENFEHGFELLKENEYEDAAPFLARAVHLAGGNARYRAYFGKALSSKKETYRQAEAEFQAALRIEPDNAEYRLMLAELFVRIGLVKRAESELNRILEKSPDHREARSLLDSLHNK